jgi:CRP-like cAMP-binding protein
MGFNDIFDELEPAERVELLDHASEETYQDGERIIEQDQENPNIYVLLDGEVSVRRWHEDGTDVEVARLGVGAIFGEMAFLTRDTASADVVAAGEVTALRLGHEHVQHMVRKAPTFAGRFYRSVAVTLAVRLRNTSRKL